jgi:UDP-N-acetylglucosamine 4,6-dehydratase
MNYKNKRFLITGACGTIGSEILKNLLSMDATVCAFDISENGLFNLQKKFQSKYKNNLKIFLGCIRNFDRLSKAMNKVDYVIHCAALKHVEIAEYNTFESVLTNIKGVQNVIDTALLNNVKKVLFVSSDKSVNPSGVMGTTKLMGEKLITSANNYAGDKITKFSSVRFGNVLNSSGSVLEVFKKQLEKKKPLTITSKKMTRYFITIEQAIKLCFFSLNEMVGGEIFIRKMDSFDVLSLAKAISKDKNQKIIFTKPGIGEKLYEELVTENECLRTIIFKLHYVIMPEISRNNVLMYNKIFNKYNHLKKIKEIYRSDKNLLSLHKIKFFLKKEKLI